jgi:outer membrane protein insertion porin family
MLFVAILLLASASAFAQGQEAAPQPPIEAKDVAQSDWYVGKPIKAFRFVGLVTVKESDLNRIVAPYVGQSFNRDPLLTEVESKLYAVDYFQAIVAKALPADDEKTGVIIELDVTERPLITAVVVAGNSGIKTGDITDKILSKKGDLAIQGKLLADAAAVRSLYMSKGFADGDVKAAFVPGDRDNTVKAVFTIAEGLPTAI